jgi:hypothetical protein
VPISDDRAGFSFNVASIRRHFSATRGQQRFEKPVVIHCRPPRKI